MERKERLMGRGALDRSKVVLLRARDVREQYGLDPKTLEKWAGMGLPVRWVDLPASSEQRKGERRWVRESVEECLAGLSGGGGE